MDLPQEVEIGRIAPVEIDGDNGQAALLDETDHIGSPRFVFHHGVVCDGRAPVFFLIGSHFSGREEPQGAAVLDVLQGHPDAVDAAGVVLAAQVVHREEVGREVGNEGKHKGGENLVILPAAAHRVAEDEAVQGTEMMVGDGDEASFGGNEIQLLLRNVIGDAYVLKDTGGKVRTHQMGAPGLGPVHFIHFQDLVHQGGKALAHPALQAQRTLEVLLA